MVPVFLYLVTIHFSFVQPYWQLLLLKAELVALSKKQIIDKLKYSQAIALFLATTPLLPLHLQIELLPITLIT